MRGTLVHKPVVAALLGFLSPETWYTLRQVVRFPPCFPDTSQHFRACLLYNLTRFYGEQVAHIVLDHLNRGCVLTGSFALCTWTNVFSAQQCGDVDIAVLTEENHIFISPPKLLPGPMIRTLFVGGWFAPGHWFKRKTTAYSHPSLVDVIAFEVRDASHPLELIFTSNVRQYIEEFDLSCCRIAFDGTHLSMSHYRETLERVATVNVDAYLTCMLEGLSHMEDEDLLEIATKRWTRIQKYVQRGFEIRWIKSDAEVSPIQGVSQYVWGKWQTFWREKGVD